MIEEIIAETMALRQNKAEAIAKLTHDIAKLNLILAALQHSPYVANKQEDCPT